MAGAITMQGLIDAGMDSDSLETLVNGDENTQVVTRTGATYPSAKKAINTMFQNGGLPATPFATKALLNSSAGSYAQGDYGQVTDDGVNNGLYIRDGQGWAKSEYDPLIQAKTYIDSNPLSKPVALTSSSINNTLTSGIYLQISSANATLANGYPITESGVLEVFDYGNSLVLQRYTTLASGKTYNRTLSSSGFRAWTTLNTFKDDINARLDSSNIFTPKTISASTDLDTLVADGDYHKVGSGDINATLNHYPEQSAGVLTVKGYGTSLLVQRYTVYSNGRTYTRYKTSSGFVAWAQIATHKDVADIIGKYPAILEWQATAGSVMRYDATTRTVEFDGYFIASFGGESRRIRINDISIALPDSYSVCYLDLIALGSVREIDSINYTQYIKVGRYDAAAGAGQYVPTAGYVPLFKYNLASDKAEPAAGFLPIITTGGVDTTTASPCYYQYSNNSLKVYSQVKDNLYVGFNVLYQFYDDDIIYEKYWRIANADFYTFDNGAMTATGLSALEIGESEFVFKQSAAKADFTGGYHGDEQLTDVVFLANGLPVAITGAVPLTACDTFEYIIKSTMHETTETAGSFIAGHPVIANHIKRTGFLDGGYKTYNKLIFNYSGTVATVYHGISCISSDVANVVMTDKTFTPTAMTGSGSELMRETGARLYIGYNATNNLSVEATSRIIANPVDDLASMSWVSDRGADSKYYRRSPVDLPVSVGTVMESEFVCRFNSK